MKPISEVYVVENETETTKKYGDYVVYASMDELEQAVLEDPQYFEDKPVYVVDLNKFKRQHIVKEKVGVR